MDKKINELKDSVITEYAEETAKSYIAAMKDVLGKNGIDEPCAVYELKENALCLLFDEDRWVLAASERGKRRNIADYDDISEACERMLSLLGGEQRDILISEFRKKNTAGSVSPSILRKIFDINAKKIAMI